MRRAMNVWIAMAVGVALFAAWPESARAMDIPRAIAEVARYRAEPWPAPETPAQQMELARQFGFFRDLDDKTVAAPENPWGKPLAGGPVHALILHSWFAGGEVIALAQRLDLKYAHVALLREKDWPALGRQGPGLFEPLEARLVEGLKGGEPVVAFGSSPCPWPDLRAPTKKALLEAVKAGKGLVYCGDPAPLAQEMGKEFIADAAATKVLSGGIPADLQRITISAGQFGKGRVVFLGFPSEAEKNTLLFAPAPNDAQRDSACSLLARSLVWASRRESGVAVSLPDRLALKTEETDRFVIAAKVSGPGVQWLDWYVQRTGEAAPVAAQKDPYASTNGSAHLQLPQLPAGEYVLQLVARDADRASLAWASAALTVACDSKLKVEFNRPRYERSDSARVTVETMKAARRGLRLRCSLTDRAGRLMATETRPLAAGSGVESMLFHFPMSLAVAKTAVARATLFEGERELVSAEATAVVDVPRPRTLYLVCGDGAGEAGLESGIGLTAMVGSSENAARLELDNWRRQEMPEIRLAAAVPLDVLVRKPCLSDPDYLARSLSWVRAQARGMALTGELGLCIAHEWNYAGPGAEVSNLCHCPACEKAFRENLRAEYGTLDRLNSSWNERVADWEKAASPRWEEACQSGKWPAWIDKRRSEDALIAEFFRKCAEAGREVYPDFRLALSGTLNPSSANGCDWPKLMNAVDAVSLGDGPQVQLARSFARPGQRLLRPVREGSREADPGLGAREIYDAMFSGLDGVVDVTPDGRSPLLWPDLSLRPYGAAVARALHDLREGPADLIAGATRDDDGVAILYSQPSLHVAAVQGFSGRPVSDATYVETLAGFERLLGDLGLQFRYISGEELAADALRKRGCRLLILPFSEAVAPQETDAIRAFVSGGGIVLADLSPAVTDQHGKAYTASLLDEILGVRRKHHRPLYRRGKVFVQPQPDQSLVAMDFEAILGEPSLALNGAQAWASFEGDSGARVPAVTFQYLGAGRSILLNFGVSDYRSAGSAADGLAIRKLMGALLSATRIAPPVSVSGAPSARFSSGQAVYLGLSAPPEGARKVHVSLSGMEQPRRYIYDVRAHKFLGRFEGFDYDLRDSYGGILALMPREIGGVTLSAAGRAERGRLAPVSISLHGWRPEMGRTVFRLEVYDPDGKLKPLYTRNYACDGGRADLAIPFALNDAPGEWRLRAVEAVSGNSQEARVTLNGN